MLGTDFPYTGLSVHSHVIKLGFCQEPFIMSALIEFYTSNLDTRAAEKLFDEIPSRDVVLWTVMIDGYGKTGDIEKARKVFDEMPYQRNVISWSAMIAVYSQMSNYSEVLWLYKRMEKLGLKPNESIIVSALTACAHLGALAQGLWIHSYAKKCRYTSNPILATALVDMHAKCGCIDTALAIFENIHDKDTVAWNAIISGVAMSGLAVRSLELFNSMISCGTQPNEATFVALLTACTHAKLVGQGLSLFENMKKEYNIEPGIEHHACVVDLLSRSGKLEEAEKFIHEKMGGIVNGDANVWGALLGACRTYGKVEIGNRVWKEVLAHKGIADDYGIHVLAYNMYKEAGWDDEASGLRRLIATGGSKKIPGCSAIAVDGIMEEFVAGDVLHPQATEMCGMLCSLLCRAVCPMTLYEYDE